MTATKPFVAERSLAEEMFRLAVEACPNGMMMIDQNGTIVMVNTEIEHLFGYTREELIGQPIEILVPDRLRVRHLGHRRRATPRHEVHRIGTGRELSGMRKDGSEIPIEIGLNPIPAGDRPLVLAVIVDVSQRKQMERLKDEFVATVSHELRTPLPSIAGSLGLLAGQCGPALFPHPRRVWFRSRTRTSSAWSA
jgi:PAS domain S-box-containing protein